MVKKALSLFFLFFLFFSAFSVISFDSQAGVVNNWVVDSSSEWDSSFRSGDAVYSDGYLRVPPDHLVSYGQDMYGDYLRIRKAEILSNYHYDSFSLVKEYEDSVKWGNNLHPKDVAYDSLNDKYYLFADFGSSNVQKVLVSDSYTFDSHNTYAFENQAELPYMRGGYGVSVVNGNLHVVCADSNKDKYNLRRYEGVDGGFAFMDNTIHDAPSAIMSGGTVIGGPQGADFCPSRNSMFVSSEESWNMEISLPGGAFVQSWSYGTSNFGGGIAVYDGHSKYIYQKSDYSGMLTKIPFDNVHNSQSTTLDQIANGVITVSSDVGSYTSKWYDFGSDNYVFDNLEVVTDNLNSLEFKVFSTDNSHGSSLVDMETSWRVVDSEGVITKPIGLSGKYAKVKFKLSGSTAVDSFTMESYKPDNLNNPPNVPIDPDPPNNSDNVLADSYVSCQVSDPDGESLDVYFYEKLDSGDRELIGVDEDVVSGNRASVYWENKTVGSVYEWLAIASDGDQVTESDLWSFEVSEESVSDNDSYLGDYELVDFFCDNEINKTEDLDFGWTIKENSGEEGTEVFDIVIEDSNGVVDFNEVYDVKLTPNVMIETSDSVSGLEPDNYVIYLKDGGSVLVSEEFVVSEEVFDITEFPERVSDWLNVDLTIAELLVGGLCIIIMALIDVGFLSKTGASIQYITPILVFTEVPLMGILLMLGWVPVWTVILLALVLIGFFADRVSGGV